MALGTGVQNGVNVACVQWTTPVNFWAFLFGSIREMAYTLPRSRRNDGQDKTLTVGVAAVQLLGSVLSSNRTAAINLSALLAQDWANKILQTYAHAVSTTALESLRHLIADENFTAHAALIDDVVQVSTYAEPNNLIMRLLIPDLAAPCTSICGRRESTYVKTTF